MPGTVLPAIPPIGLLTSPNRAGGMPSGALAIARGVYLREPGVLSGQPVPSLLENFEYPALAVGPTGINAPDIVDQELVVFALWPDNVWRMSTATTISYAMRGGGEFSFERLWLDADWPSLFRWFAGSARSGLRLVVPTGYSTTILERSPIDGDTAAFRVAGLGQPRVGGASTIPSVGTTDGIIAAGNRTLYVAVIRRTYDDGVELVSFPGYPNEFTLVSGNTPGNLLVSTALPITARAGDFLDLYRCKQKPYTPAQQELGADFYLAATALISPADINVLQINILDKTPDANLGKALYTNPGVRGAAAANAMPPSCKAVVAFKGYTFYGNTNELPSVTFTVGSYWGSILPVSLGGTASTRARASAVGSRRFVGSSFLGGNVITSVPATDLAGVVAGQLLSSSGQFPVGTRVLSVNITQVTVDHNATVAASGVTFFTTDVIDINGVIYQAGNIRDLAQSLAQRGDLLGLACFARTLQDTINGTSNVNDLGAADGVTIFYQYRINVTIAREDMRIRATNGDNYVPKLPEITESPLVIPHRQRENMLRFSEENNAEACPIANYAFVGHGIIYTLKATRDALYIFASDGLWRLSGTGGSAGAGFDWRVDPVDTTLRLTNSTCVVSLADNLYALTNRGFVRIDSSGTVTELSPSRIDDQFTNSPWDPYTRAWVAADEEHREISFQPVPNAGDDDQVFIYNIDTNAFTTLNTGSVSSETSNDYFHAFWSSQYGTVYLRELTQEYYAKETDIHAGSLVLYQSIDGSNAFSIKQFNDVSLLFDADDDGLVLSVMANPKPGYPLGDSFRWTSGYLVAHRHDGSIARAASGISRNAPAAANSIMLGYTVAPGTPNLHRFHGMGVTVVTTAVRRMLRQ